jgi:hypothetical protein
MLDIKVIYTNAQMSHTSILQELLGGDKKKIHTRRYRKELSLKKKLSVFMNLLKNNKQQICEKYRTATFEDQQQENK